MKMFQESYLENLGKSEISEFSKNKDVNNITNQITEYQKNLIEAQHNGFSAAETYFKQKIELLKRTLDIKHNKVENSEVKIEKEPGKEIPKLGSDEFSKIKRHQKNAMKYEKLANELELKIKRGIEGTSRMAEVNKLRRKAKSEKNEVESAKRRVRNQLTNYREGAFKEQLLGNELSFGGGLGATEIQHIRGSQLISEANHKRNTAASYDSDARKARSAGNFSKAQEYESRAKSLRSEAASLETKGKQLKK